MASYNKFQNDRIKNSNSKDHDKTFKNSSRDKERYFDNNTFEDKVIMWNTFYRRNIHRFIEHYFGISLHLYQIFFIYLMSLCPFAVIVACRAAAKSFIIAVFACAKAVLYPKSMIVIASATKGQSKLIITEKLQKELMPMSPNLRREIVDIKTNNNNIEVIFRNGSSIVVVPATDNARGYRATLIIYEEFRMIKKDIVDTVLSPFLVVRQCGFLKNEKYSHLVEEPSEIYISSAHMKQNWMWDTMRLATKEMYKSVNNAMIIGFDYCITLKHGIRTRKQLIKEKKKLGHTAFTMEYENIMIGSSENAYFDYEMLNKCQSLKKPFYPREDIDVIDKKRFKTHIPKKENEIRVLAVDIAMVAGKDNDNTVASCIRGINHGDFYERQYPYIEAFNGITTFEQAIRIKQLFYDFEADYLVLDTRNSGISVFDELGRINYDEKRDVEYPAWTCFNDEKTADRVKSPDAKKYVFSINATATLNHEIATKFKDNLKARKIKLLVPVEEGKDFLIDKKYYTLESSPTKMANMEYPYLQTDMLINESVNLTYEYNENSNTIKVKENRNARKDRYTSCSYGSYFIDLLERDLYKDESDSMSDYLFW